MQIIGILQEYWAVVNSADRRPKQGMSEDPFCVWKVKYSGINVSEANRLNALEDENGKLKRLLAEQMLDMAAMKELLSKDDDVCRAAEAFADLKVHLGLSERWEWEISGADRKMLRYQPQSAPDTALRGRLRELVNERSSFGYQRLFALLGRKVVLPGVSRVRNLLYLK